MGSFGYYNDPLTRFYTNPNMPDPASFVGPPGSLGNVPPPWLARPAAPTSGTLMQGGASVNPAAVSALATPSAPAKGFWGNIGQNLGNIASVGAPSALATPGAASATDAAAAPAHWYQDPAKINALIFAAGKIGSTLAQPRQVMVDRGHFASPRIDPGNPLAATLGDWAGNIAVSNAFNTKFLGGKPFSPESMVLSPEALIAGAKLQTENKSALNNQRLLNLQTEGEVKKSRLAQIDVDTNIKLEKLDAMKDLAPDVKALAVQKVFTDAALEKQRTSASTWNETRNELEPAKAAASIYQHGQAGDASGALANQRDILTPLKVEDTRAGTNQKNTAAGVNVARAESIPIITHARVQKMMQSGDNVEKTIAAEFDKQAKAIKIDSDHLQTRRTNIEWRMSQPGAEDKEDYPSMVREHGEILKAIGENKIKDAKVNQEISASIENLKGQRRPATAQINQLAGPPPPPNLPATQGSIIPIQNEPEQVTPTPMATPPPPPPSFVDPVLLAEAQRAVDEGRFDTIQEAIDFANENQKR